MSTVIMTIVTLKVSHRKQKELVNNIHKEEAVTATSMRRGRETKDTRRRSCQP